MKIARTIKLFLSSIHNLILFRFVFPSSFFRPNFSTFFFHRFISITKHCSLSSRFLVILIVDHLKFHVARQRDNEINCSWQWIGWMGLIGRHNRRKWCWRGRGEAWKILTANGWNNRGSRRTDDHRRGNMETFCNSGLPNGPGISLHRNDHETLNISRFQKPSTA